MNANERESKRLEELLTSVVGAAYEVANVLGAGFLEKVYERALVRELSMRGLRSQSQVPISVCYKGHLLGEYLADVIVEDALLVEIKCVDTLANEHLAQCLNYLKASQKKMALLINFRRSKIEWRRIVLGL